MSAAAQGWRALSLGGMAKLAWRPSSLKSRVLLRLTRGPHLYTSCCLGRHKTR